MRFRAESFLACGILLLGIGGAGAKPIQPTATNIALKNGESTELGDVWMISRDCRSLMTATPEVEVLEGPPGVSVVIKPAKVVPRSVSCANAIAGGKMIV